jgi:hypothetical protein
MVVYVAELIVFDGYWGATILDYKLFFNKEDALAFISKEKGTWEVVEKTIS